MKIAVVGSRQLSGYSYARFCQQMPRNATAIISGGALGIDSYARRYALENAIPLTELLPDYAQHPGKIAPILRNRDIVNAADYVLAFWDGKSRGTRHVIQLCLECQKPYRIVDITQAHSRDA